MACESTATRPNSERYGGYGGCGYGDGTSMSSSRDRSRVRPQAGARGPKRKKEKQEIKKQQWQWHRKHRERERHIDICSCSSLKSQECCNVMRNYDLSGTFKLDHQRCAVKCCLDSYIVLHYITSELNRTCADAPS